MANLNLNETICAHIASITLEFPEKSMLEAIILKRCSTKLLLVCNPVCSSIFKCWTKHLARMQKGEANQKQQLSLASYIAKCNQKL